MKWIYLIFLYKQNNKYNHKLGNTAKNDPTSQFAEFFRLLTEIHIKFKPFPNNQLVYSNKDSQTQNNKKDKIYSDIQKTTHTHTAV